MKTVLRSGLLLASAVVIPSCNDGYHWNTWTEDRVQVTVNNLGTTSADVHAEAEYGSGLGWEEHQDFSVAGGWSNEFHVQLDSLTRLRIRIVRSVDGLEIFEGSWDRGDLDHLDERLTISVNP